MDTLGTELDHWLGSGLDVEDVVTRIIEGVTDQVANVNQQALRVELSLAAFRFPEVRQQMAPIRARVYHAIEQALAAFRWLADRATAETDRSLELRTRDRQRKLISKIDDALRRIEDGSYGYCEDTGEPISLGRLEARPTARTCIDCAAR